MVKNDDTICLARATVTANANLLPERWSEMQLEIDLTVLESYKGYKQENYIKRQMSKLMTIGMICLM